MNDKPYLIGRCADLLECDAEKIIDKKIARLIAEEYCLTLIFEDESQLVIRGGRWDGCCLGVDFYSE